MTERIRDRLGLDFLRFPSPRTTSDQRVGEDPALTDALMAFGWRFLAFLNNAEGGTAKLYDVVDSLKIPIEIALKVVDYFESLGIVQVTQRDLKGDHTLAIT